MKIDWVKKLTSRKFWLAIAGFVSSILAACNLEENKIAQIIAVIMAGACVVAYIVGEGLIDQANIEKQETEIIMNKERQNDEDLH